MSDLSASHFRWNFTTQTQLRPGASGAIFAPADQIAEPAPRWLYWYGHRYQRHQIFLGGAGINGYLLALESTATKLKAGRQRPTKTSSLSEIDRSRHRHFCGFKDDRMLLAEYSRVFQ